MWNRVLSVVVISTLIGSSVPFTTGTLITVVSSNCVQGATWYPASYAASLNWCYACLCFATNMSLCTVRMSLGQPCAVGVGLGPTVVPRGTPSITTVLAPRTPSTTTMLALGTGIATSPTVVTPVPIPATLIPGFTTAPGGVTLPAATTTTTVTAPTLAPPPTTLQNGGGGGTTVVPIPIGR